MDAAVRVPRHLAALVAEALLQHVESSCAVGPALQHTNHSYCMGC